MKDLIQKVLQVTDGTPFKNILIFILSFFKFNDFFLLFKRKKELLLSEKKKNKRDVFLKKVVL